MGVSTLSPGGIHPEGHYNGGQMCPGLDYFACPLRICLTPLGLSEQPLTDNSANFAGLSAVDLASNIAS